jgi:hypothetical protein
MEHFEYNQEATDNFSHTEVPKWPDVRVSHRRLAEVEVVNQYMDYYNAVIEERILANNENLYTSMTRFLLGAQKRLNAVGALIAKDEGHIVDHSAFNLKKEAASQIPTCLVITSSESASSIETQFDTVAEQLEKSLKSVNIVMDEKKCGTMK